MITILFWAYGYDGNNSLIADIATHGFGLLLMIIDLFFISFPVRILHAIYSFTSCVVYVLFTVIYWAAGGPNIYAILDWDQNAEKTLGYSMGLVFIGIPVIHCLVFSAWKLIICCHDGPP